MTENQDILSSLNSSSFHPSIDYIGRWFYILCTRYRCCQYYILIISVICVLCSKVFF